MYQGKFDAKARGQQAPGKTLEQILRDRDAAIAARAAAKASRSAARGAAPAQSEEIITPKKSAPQAAKKQPAKMPAPAAKPQQPVKNQVEMVQPPKKQGARIGSLVFYSIFFLFIFANFIGIFLVLNALNPRLSAYQLAQPGIKSNEVFQQLFTDPDWGQLYSYAGIEDTDFEGSEEYVRYMEKKVGSQELNFVETSAGLDAFAKKYLVRLGNEKIASFKIVDKNQSDGSSILSLLKPDAKDPDWQLGAVELFFERNESFRIKKLENHVAYVNGVPLDNNEYAIQITSSRVDEFLPVGATSVRTSILEINDLMAEPEITVYNETGTEKMVALYNPESGMYEEQTSAITITDEERAAVFGALEAKCGFMINANGSREAVNKYFDVSSAAYKELIDMRQNLVWNTDRGHEFVNQQILFYSKHSDTLFSVRATVTMRTTLKGNTEDRDYVATESMFFILKNGQWCCTETMNIDISQPIGQVRLTFKDAQGTVLSDQFYATDVKSFPAPPARTPAGQRFVGWYRIVIDEDGNKSGEVMFAPDENGNINLTGDKPLEPMTLYPHFENV